MKKVLAAILCVMFFVSSSFAFKLIPKVGVDIPSTMTYDAKGVGGHDEETKRGYNIAVETRADISNYFAWGIGLEYNFPRGLTTDISFDTDFSFMPIYASLIFYPLGAWNKARPYIKGNIGYNVYTSNDIGDDEKGGFYWAAGIGTEYKDFIGEMSISEYNGEYTSYTNVDVKYRKIGFALGYKFNIDIFKSKTESEQGE